MSYLKTEDGKLLLLDGKLIKAPEASSIDTSDATATPSDILNGKTAYVGDVKITGTHICPVPTIETEEKSVTPSESTQEITPTSGKYLSKVVVNAIPNNYIIPSGNLNITENGTDIDVKNYEKVSVNVTTGITPTGSLDITESGTYDVTNYASVNVNVPTPSVSFDEASGTLTIETSGGAS